MDESQRRKYDIQIDTKLTCVFCYLSSTSSKNQRYALIQLKKPFKLSDSTRISVDLKQKNISRSICMYGHDEICVTLPYYPDERDEIDANMQMWLDDVYKI